MLRKIEISSELSRWKMHDVAYDVAYDVVHDVVHDIVHDRFN